MSRIFVISTFLFACILTSAQEDEKAKEILDKVSEKISSFSTISMDFTSTMGSTEMKLEEKNEGSIKIKGKKYTADIYSIGNNNTKKLILKRYSDGKILWNYMPDGKQVTISNLEDDENDLMNPTSLFSIYDKGFKSKFIKETTESNIRIFIIELYPIDDKYDISKISLKINKTTMMIHSFILYDINGSFYNIKVKNLVTNKAYFESEFVFDSSQYEDIEEIDMR